jgi:hypothetical protein
MNFWDGAEDFDAAQTALHAAGLTDGLPVVPPTQARVNRMLADNGVVADDVVALIPPLYGEATWRTSPSTLSWRAACTSTFRSSGPQSRR